MATDPQATRHTGPVTASSEPVGAPTRADAHRNRAAVMAAAIEVLSRHPDAPMKDVAEASGLGRTTVYRHFPSREALITALFEEVLDASVAEVRAIIAEYDDPREVLPRIARETLSIGERYRFLEAHRGEGMATLRQPREDPFLEWIDRALAARTLRPLGATWIHGMVVAMIMGAHDEVLAGRESAVGAAAKLGETLVAAFAQ